ncbi:MAG: cytochrome ubiquinol oxidase subunit I [Bacteriovoracia bacterium]
MSELVAARSLMALSLGFHIIFAIVGMILPLLVALAHYKFLRTDDLEYQKISKWWMRGLGIFFATGAVSGTALSFELGLLWPTFMLHAGPIFGMPFSWEGTAFFLEAIFLGLYLFGEKRLSPWVHWRTGIGVGACGVLSGVFVVAANAWMNSPAGFDWINGKAENIDPVAAMFNDAWFSQAQHTLVSAMLAVGLVVIGVHAWLWLRGSAPRLNQKAIVLVLPWTIAAALLTPVSGDFSAKDVARRQPLKLAALEAHFETTTYAPLVLGGIPNLETKNVEYAIKIPGLLSLMAFNDPSEKVQGLNDFPRENWPPVVIVHLAFQVMVGIGSLLAMLALLQLIHRLRFKKYALTPIALKIMVLLAPLGFVAVEAGWVVTEVGRQPWIIYEILRTKDSLTLMPGLPSIFTIFLVLYLFLGVMVIWLMRRQFQAFALKETA